jgi:dGTPase
MDFENRLDDSELTRREKPREEDLRGHYFRDTTAIIHSYPFRRLRHKTQVFFAPKNDHICTRIEHVMHVATIGSTLCRALGLDPDIAWAVSLAHDLGHTPFGHVGERIIEEIFADTGGFAHELYSLRVVDHLIHYGEGINLTYAVRDGIVTHCGERFEQTVEPDHAVKDLSAVDSRAHRPATYEAAVVRMADKIAYLGRDLEDAVQLGLVTKDQVPRGAGEVLGYRNSDIIDTLVNDCVEYSRERGVVGFSDERYEALLELKRFNYRYIYKADPLNKYYSNFRRILSTLADYLGNLFGRFGFDSAGYGEEQNLLAIRFGDYCRKMRRFYEEIDKSSDLVVLDYLAGMTDDYAIDCISEIMVPKSFEFQFEARLYNG